MNLKHLRAQLTELQRQEDQAYEYMINCEDDYWPDRYPAARERYRALVDEVETLLAQLTDAEAQGGE